MLKRAFAMVAMTCALTGAAVGQQDIPVTPPGVSIPIPPGAPANIPASPPAPPAKYVDVIIPIEMLPIDPSLAKGQLWKSGMRHAPPVIALQPARVLRVATAPSLKNYFKKAPLVFSLLGPFKKRPDGALDTDVPRAQQAWCALYPTTLTVCYQDTDGDGSFDVARSLPLDNVDSAGQAVLGADHAQAATTTLTPQIAFQELPAEQRPRYDLGYVSCSNDAKDVRFGVFARRVGDGGDINGNIITSACSLRATELSAAPEGGKLYKFDRFVVRVYEEANQIKTRLVTGVEPGTVLGQVRADRPLINAPDVSLYRPVDEQYGRTHALAFVKTPPVVKAGIVKPGEEIVSGEVAHGISGMLAAPLMSGGSLGTKLLAPAGAPVYATPMKPENATDSTLVWCAPSKNQRGEWESVCLPRALGRYLILDKIQPAFTRSGFVFSPALRSATTPVIEPGPVSFGAPLRLSLRYDGWENNKFKFTLRVAPNGEPGGDSTFTGNFSANGRARLDYRAGSMVFEAAPGDPTAIIVLAVQNNAADRNALSIPQMREGPSKPPSSPQ